MRIVPERPRRRVDEAPRHPEVNQQDATTLEPDNQILAATLEAFDRLTLELGSDLERVERAHQPPVQDLHALEPATGHGRLEEYANRLDLGKLGHARTLADDVQHDPGRLGPLVAELDR